MKKLTFIKMMLLAVIFMAGSAGLYAQGSETFETQNVLTASYLDGTFESETAGVTVNYGHSRDQGDYSITGKGIMIRRASDSYVEFVIPNGVGDFSFEYRKAFTGANARQLEVIANDETLHTTDQFGGVTGADPTIHTATVTVNKEGSVTVKIKNVGTATTNKQTIIDNVSWTAFGGTSTPDPDPLAAPVATAAESITSTSFTANWNAVDGATGYKLYVYTKAGSEGEQTLVEGFDKGTTAPIGWTFDGALGTYTSDTNFGAASPSLKFGATGHAVTTPILSSAATELSFWIKGQGTQSNAENSFKIEGFDGSSWVLIQNLTSDIPTSGTTYTYNASSDPVLPANLVQFRFTYTKSLGNIAFDDVSITYGSSSTPAPAPVNRPYRVNPATDTQITGSPFDVAGGATTSYNVTGLDNKQEYYYSVTAIRDTEESAYSNEIGPISLVPTGLLNAKLADANAWAYNGKVMVQATAGEAIEIFNVAGQKVLNRLAADGLNEVPVQLKGVAIVKVGNRVSKVIL